MANKTSKEKEKAGFDWSNFLKQILLIIIGGIIGYFGGELKNYLKQGAIQIEAQSDFLYKNSVVEIYKGNDELVQVKNIESEKTKLSLSSGTYQVKVKYGRVLIFDQDCTVKPRSTVILPVQLYLPNLINVNLSSEQTEMKKGSEFTLTITSDTDGYFWLYSIDPDGKFSYLFPVPDVQYEFDNQIQVGKERLVPNQQQDEGIKFVASSTLGEEEIIVIVTKSNNSEIALKYLSELYPDISFKASTVFEKDLYGWASLKLKVMK